MNATSAPSAARWGHFAERYVHAVTAHGSPPAGAGLWRGTRRSGASFKQAVNYYLRLGLAAAKRPTRKPFVVTPRKLGLPPGLTYDNVEQLLDALEGPAHR